MLARVPAAAPEARGLLPQQDLFAGTRAVEERTRDIRRCGNPNCVLFFYDTTRNRARQWCSMATCGNLMKVRAFRRRRRKKQ